MQKGIDVAKWNGSIDWQKVKEDGVSFAILKIINKSCDVEPSFETNYTGATKNNIPVGVYNYSYATTVEKAQSDARKVISVLNKRKIQMKVWLDVEDACQKYIGTLLISIIKAYQNIIESAGYKFGVYTGLSFYNTFIKPYGLLNCDLWIARYPSSNQMKLSDAPDETKKPSIGQNVYAWQYSSKGKVNGISTNCDLSILYGEKIEQKTKSGAELAEYALSNIGTPYFFGAKMNVLTENYMAQMHKLYPGTVTTNYMQKARNRSQVGKVNTDCSGLIGAYREKQIGSSQLYSTAKKRMPISQVNDFGVGVVLWKQGHVGVYVGNGYCVEAKGIDYGTIKSKVSDTKWQYGLTFDDMMYRYEKTVCGKEKMHNPYKEPTALLKRGAKGDAVKWLQFELNESGFDLIVDGIFGDKTYNAVISYQKSCKIEVDGIVGKVTRSYLKNE